MQGEYGLKYIDITKFIRARTYLVNMDEMSPRTWTGLDHFPALDEQLRREAAGAVHIVPVWLSALPCAASVISASDGRPYIEHWNQRFSALVPRLLDPQSQDQPRWVDECRAAIAMFVDADQDRHDFVFERDSPIGMESFAAALAWVPGMKSVRESILFTVIDRTTDRRVEENLRRELVSDTLTTLPNRIGFGEAIETTLERRELAPECEIMVMIVDLMRFSRINESLGSMEGDELILTVAKRLKSILDDSIALGRLGGNEFGLCCKLPNGITDATMIAEQVRDAIARPVKLSHYQISVDCAIGCAVSPAGSAQVDELIRQAQSAVRTAKRTDRFEIYRAGVLKAARRRFQIESRLRDALASGSLTLVYQPLVDLATGGITGFEALTRWTDEELGVVPPYEFIQVAEDSGLIVQLGRWTLNEALQQLTRWDRQMGEEVPLRMNVNLSPIQVARDDVISMVRNALRLSGVDGHRLTLEMTESAIVGDADNCRSLLNALKTFNVSIAMDDFGTGYSNMASLQSLPIDVLKIDRSFVTDMLLDADKHAIIRAILSLAEALKLRTTAEGIEEGDVALALRDMGCTTGQGYFYAKPMEADRAFAYWKSRWNFEMI